MQLGWNKEIIPNNWTDQGVECLVRYMENCSNYHASPYCLIPAEIDNIIQSFSEEQVLVLIGDEFIPPDVFLMCLDLLQWGASIHTINRCRMNDYISLFHRVSYYQDHDIRSFLEVEAKRPDIIHLFRNMEDKYKEMQLDVDGWLSLFVLVASIICGAYSLLTVPEGWSDDGLIRLLKHINRWDFCYFNMHSTTALTVNTILQDGNESDLLALLDLGLSPYQLIRAGEVVLKNVPVEDVIEALHDGAFTVFHDLVMYGNYDAYLIIKEMDSTKLLQLEEKYVKGQVALDYFRTLAECLVPLANKELKDKWACEP